MTRRARRDEVGEFLAEGPRAVREAVRRPGVVREVFGTPAALDLHGDWLAEQPIELVPVSAKTAAALSETVHPQGLIARCRYLDVPLADSLIPDARLVAVLAGISDPGNAGTVLRTADAAGADLVVFTAGSVDPYNGKCIRASAGSLFHVPVVRAADYGAVRALLRDRGVPTWGASADAEHRLGEPATDALLSGPAAWVFGSEAHGLTGPDGEIPVDRQVAIPIFGMAESLNLAAAASICLYASALAQHRRADS